MPDLSEFWSKDDKYPGPPEYPQNLKAASGKLKGWKIHPEGHGDMYPMKLNQVNTVW